MLAGKINGQDSFYKSINNKLSKDKILTQNKPITLKSKAASQWRKKSLFQLFSFIATKVNRNALDELLTNRKVFFFSGKCLRFSEYISNIHNKIINDNDTDAKVIDCAYNKTIDKFTNLIAEDNTGETSGRSAINCRNYYKALISLIEKWQASNPDVSNIEIEQASANIFQKFVVKHFHLSLRECRRSLMPFAKRYIWKTDGKNIPLWYPIEIPASDFRKWLNEFITELKPDQLKQKDRIQAKVYQYFGRNRFVEFEPEKYNYGSYIAKDYSQTDAGVNSLAITITQEKALNIDKLRPAIRKLGRENLKLLIMRVFRDLADDIFNDDIIAKDFSLSKATFSRFAGSGWKDKQAKANVNIPDLWLNTAKVLSTNHDFIEMAEKAGYLTQMTEVLARMEKHNESK